MDLRDLQCLIRRHLRRRRDAGSLPVLAGRRQDRATHGYADDVSAGHREEAVAETRAGRVLADNFAQLESRDLADELLGGAGAMAAG